VSAAAVVVPLAFLDGIGLSEMLVIAFLAILVFGGRLPEVMRNLGRSYAKFRQGLHDMSRPIREEIQSATTLPAIPEPATPPTAPAAPPAPSTGYDVGSSAPAVAPNASTEAGPRPWPAAPAPDPFEEPPPV
jgi:sec-independent protein translocase protein TatA